MKAFENNTAKVSKSSKATNHETRDLVASFTADQLVSVQHTLRAISMHLEDSSMDGHHRAKTALKKLFDTLTSQRSSLEMHLQREYGGKSLETSIKEALTNASGFFVGLYGSIRSQPVSRIVRDDITAANFLATCYSMLHAISAAFEEHKTATLASTYHRELTPLIIELSRVVPTVVVEELVRAGYAVNQTAINESVEDVIDAWSQDDHFNDN